MSFAQPFSEARSIISSIQVEKMDGNDGGMGSPIYKGSAESPIENGPSHPIPVLEPRRTAIYTRTDSQARQYASTGSGDGPTQGNKGYSGKLGRKNLKG